MECGIVLGLGTGPGARPRDPGDIDEKMKG